MRTPITLLAILCLLPVGAAQADVCDNIDDLATGWASIADALEQDADAEIADLDLDKLERDVDTLMPWTEGLGEDLADFGNRREEKMGEDLLDFIDALYDVDGDDYTAFLVDRIDDVVDMIDHIVDYCDSLD
ncbi:MAG: hypothetical protein AAF560_06340 [Acidobacteriota bacterium]